MQNEKCTGAQVKQSKHMELHDAVESIDALHRMADEIVCRIKGEPTADDAGLISTAPCFLEVLDGSPQSIRQKVEAARTKMMEISDLLF